MLLTRFENSSRLFIWLSWISFAVAALLVVSNVVFLFQASAKTKGVIVVDQNANWLQERVHIQPVINYVGSNMLYSFTHPYIIVGASKEVELRYDPARPENVRVTDVLNLWLPTLFFLALGGLLHVYAKVR
jgi:hypothetical protein